MEDKESVPRPLERVEVEYEAEKEKYLARPGAPKSIPHDIEELMKELTGEQKAQVLRAANSSGLSLVDMTSYIAMLVLDARMFNIATQSIRLTHADLSRDYQAVAGNQKLFFDNARKNMDSVSVKLEGALSAVLKRTDEALELLDNRATEVVAQAHERTNSGAVAREAVEVAQKEATKAIFKEIGGALKGYVKKEVEAQIHKKTAALNAMWACGVIALMCAAFWLGRVVH